MYVYKCLLVWVVVSVAAGPGGDPKQPTTKPTKQQQDFYDRGYADAEQSFEDVIAAYDEYVKELEAKVKSRHQLDANRFEYERGVFAGELAARKKRQAEIRKLKKQMAETAHDVEKAEESGRRFAAEARSKDYRLGYKAGKKDGYDEGYMNGYKVATEKYKKAR